MKTAEPFHYLIAVNFIDLTRSRLLEKIPCAGTGEKINLKDLRKKVNVAEFIGKGYGIYLCRKLELPAEEEEIRLFNNFDFNLNIEGEIQGYLRDDRLYDFPLIEGDFNPGIYQILEDSEYFEIKDTNDLSEIYTTYDCLNFEIEKTKLHCSEGAVEMRLIEDDSVEFIAPRHPFSFYDVHCPLCGEKVIYCQTNPGSLKCQPENLSCPHFIREISLWSFGYEEEVLNDLELNSKFEKGKLYFETSAGWQPAIIYTPPHDPINSYWDGSKNSEDPVHMLYVKTR